MPVPLKGLVVRDVESLPIPSYLTPTAALHYSPLLPPPWPPLPPNGPDFGLSSWLLTSRWLILRTWGMGWPKRGTSDQLMLE